MAKMEGGVNPHNTCFVTKIKKGKYSTLWFEKYYDLFLVWYGEDDE